LAEPIEHRIRLGRWSRYVVLLWGVTPARAAVRLDAHEVVVRFGFFVARIALADIERWDVTGPYRWVRAIGVRHTLFSRDISFCGDAHGAVRLWLRAPRRIAWVTADQVYVGVEDLEGFAAGLTRLGIPGEDLRQR
jgi:hypothetical protein